MSGESPKLREAAVNTWEQVGHGNVFVSYYSDQGRHRRAMVIRRGYDTDPGGPWYNYGNKAFLGKMAKSVPEAKAWASERYGVKRWRRNGMGDWVDADADLPPLRCELERKLKRSGNAKDRH